MLALNSGPPKSPFAKGRFRGNVNIIPAGCYSIPEFKSRIQLWKRETVALATVFLFTVHLLALNEALPKTSFSSIFIVYDEVMLYICVVIY